MLNSIWWNQKIKVQKFDHSTTLMYYIFLFLRQTCSFCRTEIKHHANTCTRCFVDTTPSTPSTQPWTRPTSCHSWEYKCNNSYCIYQWDVCDGVDDCGDNSDEWFCGMYQLYCMLYGFPKHYSNTLPYIWYSICSSIEEDFYSKLYSLDIYILTSSVNAMLLQLNLFILNSTLDTSVAGHLASRSLRFYSRNSASRFCSKLYISTALHFLFQTLRLYSATFSFLTWYFHSSMFSFWSLQLYGFS